VAAIGQRQVDDGIIEYCEMRGQWYELGLWLTAINDQ
jgi:hypothetical protein